MQRRKAIYSVTIDGKDVTAGLIAVVTSITIKDAAGESADTASIDFDDADGQISLPRVGAKISIALGWEDSSGATVAFEGVVDDIKSAGSRGGGRTLEVTAKSADTRGKLKERQERHKDKGKLGDVAKAWGKDAGLSDVKIHADLEKIERPYWSMENESFLQWGSRVAREVGATFKVMGERAVMTPRSSGLSASGKALPKITARAGDGGNLINWSVSPILSRPAFKKFEKRFYDPKEAKWKRETFEAKEVSNGIEATSIASFAGSDKDTSKIEAESAGKEGDREKGGGSVSIDGDPNAQAEAECELVGARPGVDGTYRIETATHKYTRGGGFITDLDLKQPKGAAGKDERKSEPAGGKQSSLPAPNLQSITPSLPGSAVG